MKTAKGIANFFLDKPDLSPVTVGQYVEALDYLEQHCRKLPAKPAALRQTLSQVRSDWVRLRYWSVWRVFFRWCQREYGTVDPMMNVAKPKPDEVEIRALELGELRLLLAAAEDLRDKVIVALGVDCGIRASEFGRLRQQDLAPDTVRVWGKGRRQKRVPISPEAHRLLRQFIDRDGRGGPTSLIFPGRDGAGISRFAVYRIVRRAMTAAGIPGPKLGAHALRHSLGMNFIADGGDAFSLREILRHRDIGTTQKYVNLSMAVIIDQHHQHSPFRRAFREAQGILIEREVEEILEDHGVEDLAGEGPAGPRETG